MNRDLLGISACLPAEYAVRTAGGMVGLYHGSHLVAIFGAGTPEDKIVEVALRHAAPRWGLGDRELHILLHFLRKGSSPAEIAGAWGMRPGEVRRAVRTAAAALGVRLWR